MAELVTIDEAKAHLKLSGSEEDGDLDLKLTQAHALVLDYVTQQREATADVGTWAATVAAWTASTAPDQVKAAIMACFGELYRFRGDEDFEPNPERWQQYLKRLRDPAIA